MLSVKLLNKTIDNSKYHYYCEGCGASIDAPKLLSLTMYDNNDKVERYLCNECLEHLFCSLDLFRSHHWYDPLDDDTIKRTIKALNSVNGKFCAIIHYDGDKAQGAHLLERLPNGNSITLFESENVKDVEDRLNLYRARYIAGEVLAGGKS